MKRLFAALLIASTVLSHSPAHALGPFGNGPELEALENRIAELDRQAEEASRNNDYQRLDFLRLQSRELLLKKMGLHLDNMDAALDSVRMLGRASAVAGIGFGLGGVGLTRVATALVGLGFIGLADAVVNLVTDGKVSATKWILDHTIVPGTAHAATMNDYYRSKEGFGEFARLTPDQAAPFMAKDPELHKMVVETTKFMDSIIQQQ